MLCASLTNCQGGASLRTAKAERLVVKLLLFPFLFPHLASLIVLAARLKSIESRLLHPRDRTKSIDSKSWPRMQCIFFLKNPTTD